MKALDLPPFWLLAFMAGAYALERAFPLPYLPDWRVLAWALIAAALGLAIWSAVVFARARTSVIPRRTPSAIVTDGPYRFSRNPIYLADVVILIGWGFLLGSLWPVLAAPLFGWHIQERFIRAEERVLSAAFPEAWRLWSERTRRWI